MYRSAFIAVSLLPLTACMDVGSIDEEVRLEQHVLDAVAASRYRESGFVRINAQPYPTALDDANTINVWVDEASAAAFARVAPETSGSRVELAPGATIVSGRVSVCADCHAERATDGFLFGVPVEQR